jgi:polyhydroxyalkanoate synthase
MMRSHNSVVDPFASFGATEGRFPDAVGEAFAAGQALYKTNLIATLNLFRVQAGHAPLGWPSRGVTPTQLMWSDGPVRLLRFAGPKPHRAPILCVCSLVNRPYVIDLLPGRSVVEALQRDGRELWLLDWGTPEPATDALGLEHFALGLIPRALAEVEAGTGQTPHLLGYCMGGTLSLIALAAGTRARSLTCMATPVDLHDDGLLSLWTRAPGFDPRTVVSAYGHAPPHLLQPAFKMLDPVGLSTKLVRARERIGDDAFMAFFLAMEQWLEDSVAFPGRAFVEWVQLYRDNALLRARFRVGARELSLREVTTPLLSLIAEGDYISPPRSCRAIEIAAPRAAQRVLTIDGGHIGLATGAAAHKSVWPEVSGWLDAVEAGARGRVVRSHKRKRAARAQRRTP